jgi:nucleoid DNA-binding protein
MNKPEIAKKIARRSGVSRAEAADRLDTLVSGIIARLRDGKDADLPGLGRFVHAADGSVSFERSWSGKRG